MTADNLVNIANKSHVLKNYNYNFSAYDRIGRMFRETGRYYASKEIVVITDFVE